MTGLPEIQNSDRIEGKDFWPAARQMLEDFPSAAKALAEKKADECGLSGLRRFISVHYNTHRIMNLRESFAMASLVRAAFGSGEDAKTLLEQLACYDPPGRLRKTEPDINVITYN